MVETFFGFKKTPFCDSPDPKQLFSSQAWNQAKARLQFWPIITALACSPGKSAPVNRPPLAASPLRSIQPIKVLYLHWTSRSTLDLLRQLALLLDLQPAHYRGDLARRSPGPSCTSIRIRSSTPFSSPMKPSCCVIPRSNNFPCC